MNAHERAAAVAREWAAKAENDLKNAVHVLKLGRACPTDTVCFHAEQCAEKYLKAALVLHKVPFPKTHDIGELLALLPVPLAFVPTPKEQRRLSSYATVTRYPGDYDPIALTEARRAVAIARRLRTAALMILLKRPLPGG